MRNKNTKINQSISIFNRPGVAGAVFAMKPKVGFIGHDINPLGLVLLFSKHWPSGSMLSISRNVCPCVCLSVCSLLRYRFNIFLPPLSKVRWVVANCNGSTIQVTLVLLEGMATNILQRASGFGQCPFSADCLHHPSPPCLVISSNTGYLGESMEKKKKKIPNYFFKKS